jgi:Mn2+/Fe2+ NRAMP family transporter
VAAAAAGKRIQVSPPCSWLVNRGSITQQLQTTIEQLVYPCCCSWACWCRCSVRIALTPGCPAALQVCREAYPPAVCYLLWVLAEISIVALDLTMVLGEP